MVCCVQGFKFGGSAVVEFGAQAGEDEVVGVDLGEACGLRRRRERG